MLSETIKPSFVLFLLCFCSLIYEIKPQVTFDATVATLWTDAETPLATSALATNASTSRSTRTTTDIPLITIATVTTTTGTTSRTTTLRTTTKAPVSTTTPTTTTTHPNKGEFICVDFSITNIAFLLLRM
ncbi:unnamed protein product [Adineta ricciae]|uniref:Integumentary mucin C.1-like n=1 Tax=Adineta ricciae TaxID=249248 RepID=A0A815PSM4_ADIRI|nr:unnamed protein product [Adineta ricciae]